MKRFPIFLLFALIVINTASIIQGQSLNSQEEAKRIWELAIQAKGGREKLNEIQNIQISTQGRYRLESLTIFPNKAWDWEDYRPSLLGLSMSMYNLETGKRYDIQQGEKNPELKPFEANDPVFAGVFSHLVWLVLENRWFHPIPEKAVSGTVGFQKVDIIQTRMNGQRIDFALSRKNHLPVKVSYYLPDATGGGEHIAVEKHLSDYFDYKGIKVPKTVDNTKVTYQFNVEYNEDIFTTPPLPAENAAEAWKAKK